MERYSKTSTSKWQSRYSEEFKRFVRNEFLTGTATRQEIERMFKKNAKGSVIDCSSDDIAKDSYIEILESFAIQSRFSIC